MRRYYCIQGYLLECGYLNESVRGLSALRLAVLLFQEQYNISGNGEMNYETMYMVNNITNSSVCG